MGLYSSKLQALIFPASIFPASRPDRYTQSSLNGIVMYKPDQMKDYVNQFEAIRTPTFESILAVLQEELEANKHGFRDFWKTATECFELNPDKYRGAIKTSEGAEFPDQCHIALICYSIGFHQESIYYHLNEECRNACSGGAELGAISNKSMFLLIRFVMENKAEVHIPEFLYRGCHGSFSEKDEGKVLGFGHFTSTSRNQSTGCQFTKGGGAGGTIFLIDGTKLQKDHPTKFIPMKGHSEYPDEDEYILSPFQLYSVKSVDSENQTTVVRIQVY